MGAGGGDGGLGRGFVKGLGFLEGEGGGLFFFQGLEKRAAVSGSKAFFPGGVRGVGLWLGGGFRLPGGRVERWGRWGVLVWGERGV